MSSRRNRIMLLLAVADTLVTLGAGTALARGPAEGVTRHEAVSYDDLNLKSAGGRAEMNRRIDAAVLRVCDDGGRMSEAAWRCRMDARHDARHQLDTAIARGTDTEELATRN